MSLPLRLAIVTTHPIQYQVPWFQELARRKEVELTVLYGFLPPPAQQGAGFGVAFEWDIPLLEGYRHRVMRNRARPAAKGLFRCDTPEVATLVAEFDVVVVHGWAVKTCLQALWGCRRHGVPCVIHGEATLFKKRPWVVRVLHRVILRQYAAALAVGRANRDFYLANGVPAGRVFLAPYAVDNPRFARAAEGLRGERADLRRAWGIDGGATCFLFCGKLVPKKHPLHVLDALQQAAALTRAAGRSLHALFAGDGELRQACVEFARAREIRASFAGFLNQTEIVRAYVAADALVLPSNGEETWGLVVNEAMACGRPAIVSDRVGCHPDLVPDGRTGAVFPFGDIATLAERMAELSEPSRLAAAGAAARDLIQQYSMERRANGTLEAVGVAARRLE